MYDTFQEREGEATLPDKTEVGGHGGVEGGGDHSPQEFSCGIGWDHIPSNNKRIIM